MFNLHLRTCSAPRLADGADRPARVAPQQAALHPHRARHHHRRRLRRGHGRRGQRRAGPHRPAKSPPWARTCSRVFAGSRQSGGVNSGLGSASTITLADAEAIAPRSDGCGRRQPRSSTTAQAIANGRNWSTTVAGESPDYLKIRDWKLASGSMFTEREVRSAAKVAVIGSKTANELFGPLNPVGQTRARQEHPLRHHRPARKQGRGHGRTEPGRPHHHPLHHRHETHHRRQIPALRQRPDRQRRPDGSRPAANHQPAAPAPSPDCRAATTTSTSSTRRKLPTPSIPFPRSSRCCSGPSPASRSWSAASAS